MALKNHHDSIPNGFQFSQPEINWDSGPVWGWNQLRSMIISKRIANPRFGLSTDPNKVDWEMEQQNVARLQSMPGTSHFLTSDAPPETSPPVFRRPQRLAVGVAAAGRMATGIGVIINMFGPNAEPVGSELSEKRALICSVCPRNERGNLLQRFTADVVSGIQSTLGIVKEMNLETSSDSKLGTCTACECPCAFKCHVPIDVIESKTSPETMSEFDPACWILEERKRILDFAVQFEHK